MCIAKCVLVFLRVASDKTESALSEVIMMVHSSDGKKYFALKSTGSLMPRERVMMSGPGGELLPIPTG